MSGWAGPTLLVALGLLAAAGIAFASEGTADAESDLRIIAGQQADIDDYPFVVQVQVTKGSKTFGCGGTLIASRWVLTAAHCVLSEDAEGNLRLPPLSKFWPVFGRNGWATWPFGHSRGVVEVIPHPKYSRHNPNYDIALIELESPPLASKASVIPLASVAPAEDSRAIVLGWGVGSRNRLNKSRLPLLADEDCGIGQSGTFDPGVELCVGAIGQGDCFGDSGGPLVTKQGRSYTLVGVVNRGPGNRQTQECFLQFPSTFADVSAHTRWINKTIRRGGVAVSPSIKVSPSSGNESTIYDITVRGLTPSGRYRLMIWDGEGKPVRNSRHSATTRGKNASNHQWVWSPSETPGRYKIRVKDLSTNKTAVAFFDLQTSVTGGWVVSPFDTATVDGFGGSSLQLDGSGNPVIAYYDIDTTSLKLTHCNDPFCLGADESISTVDNIGAVGSSNSMALDSAGNPVISYYDATNFALKVAHCNDPNCAGGNESIVTLDDRPTGNAEVGEYTSLLLDAAGNPVISYQDWSGPGLKLAHCNDPNCAGGNESIQAVDQTQPPFHDVAYTSLQLDASGNPVIGYYHFNPKALKLAHCNDPNCSGGNESIQVVDNSAARIGEYSSLQLDPSGNPVLSYTSWDAQELRIAHCNDANCSGGNESIAVVDTVLGCGTSLALDSSGRPVVAYFETEPHRFCNNSVLKVAHCNDANCTGGNEDIESVENTFFASFPSLVLDPTDRAVVSYADGAPHFGVDGEMKVARRFGRNMR